ncbi:MAG: PDZ domain-containing protein [Gemmatimonadaceae bacterium]|nr:PDZ domain-containing protein [Gemmatimonadaceae bacterium]
MSALYRQATNIEDFVSLTRSTFVLVSMCMLSACTPADRSDSSQLVSATAGRVVVGIGVRDVRPIDLQRTGGNDIRGAYIGTIMPGSPAERVGLRVGDVVLEANRTPIMRSQDLQQLIAAQQAGAVLELIVQRSGQVVRVSVQARQESGRIG